MYLIYFFMFELVHRIHYILSAACKCPRILNHLAHFGDRRECNPYSAQWTVKPEESALSAQRRYGHEKVSERGKQSVVYTGDSEDRRECLVSGDVDMKR